MFFIRDMFLSCCLQPVAPFESFKDQPTLKFHLKWSETALRSSNHLQPTMSSSSNHRTLFTSSGTLLNNSNSQSPEQSGSSNGVSILEGEGKLFHDFPVSEIDGSVKTHPLQQLHGKVFTYGLLHLYLAIIKLHNAQCCYPIILATCLILFYNGMY